MIAFFLAVVIIINKRIVSCWLLKFFPFVISSFVETYAVTLN